MNVPKISSKTSLFLLLLVISTLTIIPYLGLTNFHTKGEPREAIVAVSMLQNDNWILPINNGGDIHLFFTGVSQRCPFLPER